MSRASVPRLLFITLFNSILGLSVLFPILAPLGRELGLSELQVGSLSASYALMQVLVSPAWGRLSERIGRKPVLLTGVLGFGVSFLGFALLADWGGRAHWPTPVLFGALLAARLLGGAFSSATLPTAQAYMADMTGRRDRTAGMAMIGAAFGLGVIFGPLIGAAFSLISLLAAVYFSAGIAFLNFAFVWFFLPESERRASEEAPKSTAHVARLVWPLLAVGFTLSLASVAMEQTISFYYQDRLQLSNQATPRTVGMALGVYGVVAVFTQGFLVRRYKWSPLRLMAIGMPVALLGYSLLVFADRFALLTLALAAQAFGQSLAVPGVTAGMSLGVSEDEQGIVAGLNSSALGFGRMLGPLAGTGLYEIRAEYPYVLSSVLIVIVMLSVMANRGLRHSLRSDAA
ncbi:MAG TPA: MFS transporter [Polyangiaceae bacterium]|jgi:MFS family permease|nr:MFS transporter [Polyangiaceae bacterium]